MRVLYIVSKRRSAKSQQIFSHMRRDMSTAVVEMTYDRRTGERRKSGEDGRPERRHGDRRQHRVDEEFARTGWARVQVE